MTDASKKSKHADSGRLGKAVEHLVAAKCIIASRAKLNASTSLVDDEGVDLVFHRRGGTATLAVQVKARFSDASEYKRGRFRTDVRRKTFTVRSDLAMLFVPVDIATATFEFVWLVPSARFADLATGQGDTLVMSAALKSTSGDKWSSFKVPTGELHTRVLEALAQLDGTGQ